MEVERIPLDKAVEMVLSNQISDAKTQVCILKIGSSSGAGKSLNNSTEFSTMDV